MTRVFSFFSAWQQHLMLLWRSKRLVFVLESGQGLAEYALILALIAIVAIVALIFLGGQVSKILSNVGHSV
jgi:pilus assembly protein Flp/PilA